MFICVDDTMLLTDFHFWGGFCMILHFGIHVYITANLHIPWFGQECKNSLQVSHNYYTNSLNHNQ